MTLAASRDQRRSVHRSPASSANEPTGAGSSKDRSLRRLPLLPALVFTIAVTQVPFLITLVLSFVNWNALYPDDIHFAGFDNYVNAFRDATLRGALLTTVEITVLVVVISLALGLGIALLLDRAFWGRGVVRTLVIAPFLVVPVAAALVWKHALLNPSYGLFNGILTWIGSVLHIPAAQPDWVSAAPLGAVVAQLVWQWTPFMTLIILAGLQGRPLDVIEAARIDGASEVQIFRHMTFPYLRRYLELAALLGTIYVVQNFDTVFTLTSGSLGTENMPYAIFQQFFLGHDYGGASASGVIVVILSIAIATFVLRTVSNLLKEESA